jgi:hypothetical protein
MFPNWTPIRRQSAPNSPIFRYLRPSPARCILLVMSQNPNSWVFFRRLTAFRRWKFQRRREQLLLLHGLPDGRPLPVGLPLPGRPYWRIRWKEAGLDVSTLPFSRGYGPKPGSEEPRTYKDIGAMTDARTARRQAAAKAAKEAKSLLLKR